jgi:hypothetical protein
VAAIKDSRTGDTERVTPERPAPTHAADRQRVIARCDAPIESNPLGWPLVVGPEAFVVVGEAVLGQGHLGGVDGERGGDLSLGEPELMA